MHSSNVDAWLLGFAEERKKSIRIILSVYRAIGCLASVYAQCAWLPGTLYPDGTFIERKK